MTALTVCTIATANYMARARCLVESFLAHQSGGRAFVLLVDATAAPLPFDPQRCLTVPVYELGLPHFDACAFRWDVTGLCRALAPALLRYLLAGQGCDKLCYLDADTLIYSPLTELNLALDSSSVVLAPRLLAPLAEDGLQPDNAGLLRAGTFDPGLIAVRSGEATSMFLQWWHDRLWTSAMRDGRWLDIAAGMEGVQTLRRPGYMVSYWNLGQRRLRQAAGDYVVDSEPLCCVHFSGFVPGEPERVAAGQTRLTLPGLGDAAQIFVDYDQRLQKHGQKKAGRQAPAFGRFSDGVPIPAIARAVHAECDPAGARWPDPFAVQPDGSFRRWLNEPAAAPLPGRPLITRLALEMYRRRPDVRAAFSDPLGSDCRRFAAWFVTDCDLPACFTGPVSRSLAATQASVATGDGTIGWAHEGDAEALPGALPFLQTTAPIDISTAPAEQQTVVASIPALTAPYRANRRPGANVIGYLRSESGVGEISRGIMRALLARQYPAACTTLERVDGARQADDSLQAWPVGHPFDTNILCVNANGVLVVRSDLGEQFFAGKYNIACWQWETPRFPPQWRNRFALFNEIWVSSSFVQTTVSTVSPIPVARVRPWLQAPLDNALPRSTMGLPDGRFIFLFVFDIMNGCERKNPFGVIEAYRRAFGNSRQTHLVLKVNSLDRRPDQRQRLLKQAQTIGATVIDRYLSRAELSALMYTCDCYVSLHRAEGFGLTIAEAMLCRKPVIATAYSGNMDFMTPANSYLVKHRLVELAHDDPPYQRGETWAEPDIDHAAGLMRRVYEQSDEATAVAQRGASDIARQYGLEAAAGDMLARLDLAMAA